MRIYAPNTAAVAAKVIDGEAIIMNLLTGAYYSMDGAGAAAWALLESGASADAIAAHLAATYDVGADRARADTDQLLERLVGDELVVVSDGPDCPVSGSAARGTATYRTPELNKYTEMADLLALDPPMPALSDIPAGDGE